MNVVDNPDKQPLRDWRWTAARAFATYRRAGDVLIIPHTEVPRRTEGQRLRLGAGARACSSMRARAGSEGAAALPLRRGLYAPAPGIRGCAGGEPQPNLYLSVRHSAGAHTRSLAVAFLRRHRLLPRPVRPAAVLARLAFLADVAGRRAADRDRCFTPRSAHARGRRVRATHIGARAVPEAHRAPPLQPGRHRLPVLQRLRLRRRVRLGGAVLSVGVQRHRRRVRRAVRHAGARRHCRSGSAARSSR